MKLLLVDDDANLRKVLKTELYDRRYTIEEANCGLKAVEMIKADDFDIVLMDLNLPDITGKTVLQKIKALNIHTEVIILTGCGSIENAVEMAKLGAFDYVPKPFNLKRVIELIDKVAEKKSLIPKTPPPMNITDANPDRDKLITKNAHLLSLLEKLRDFALFDFPVLLLGESGVGKELMATEIHKASKRANKPFVPVNCGAIPENVIESELFGYEKGAFTGAQARKQGLLEIADQGTFFLDEIGDLPCLLQQKLLRFLDTKKFFRVGGVKQVHVDVRIVSATNKDLQQEMLEGRFRQDLYYRLSTLILRVPPLRARKEDIPELVDYMIEKMENFGVKNKRFSKEALKVLQNYDWPGNIRELQNVIHRTMVSTNGKGTIQPDDLPTDLANIPAFRTRTLQEVERNHILNILEEVNGKKKDAAQILGIDPKTLYRKLLTINNQHHH
ncbi:MAG: sigma-54 dependent transcriptional regulator [Desulfobacterales bacterium]